METAFLLSQFFAAIALMANFISLHFEDRKVSLSLLSVAVASVAIHLLLLEQITAASLVGFSLLYFIASIFTTNKYAKWGFVIITVVIFFATYEKPLDLLILSGSFLTLFAIFNTDKKLMRILLFFSAAFRIAFYSVIFSPVAILLESSLAVSAVSGYYRFYVKKQAKNLDPEPS